MRRIALAPLLVAVAACGSDPAPAPTPHPETLRVLTLNLGNRDGDDPHYPYRLRLSAYEDHIGAALRALRPDVVALQEVLPDHYCEAFDETDPTRPCFSHDERPATARRLLGADYAIVCDDRLHFECLGVHRDFGRLEGAGEAGLDLTGAPNDPLPLPTCSYVDQTCDEDHCDLEATASRAAVVAKWGRLDLVHLHLNAAGFEASGAFYLGARCRVGQLQQVADALDPATPTVVLGDFNFDPSSPLYEAEAAVWDTIVGDELPLRDHGERDPEGGRVPTVALGFAIDHVLSSFARGTCEVLDDPLIDAAFDFSALDGGASWAGRVDHRAVLCDLAWPAE
ncbi:MAG: hypothetical protein CSA66_01305 [Proteobacteria bacterium]|nr:MAG: hypothetical protein CSA66_01305 [Pseudomonadota bacterium]